MEPKNLDNHFKNIIETTEDHYKKASDEAKNYIWRRIAGEKPKVLPLLWQRMAVAASILILLSLTVALYLSGHQKTKLIDNLYSKIENLQNQVEEHTQLTSLQENIPNQEKTETIVKVPVIKKELIEKVKYIFDTVYVKQTVTEYKYIVRDSIQNQNMKMVNTDENKTNKSAQKEKSYAQIEYIFPDNSGTPKKEREKLFKIRYGGGDKNSSQSKSLSISTEL